jgi:hypothetical protein
MEMNAGLKGFLWGNASGAVAVLIVGLTTGWIVGSGKADVMARKRADAAVTAVMTPVCVERFQRAEGYATKLATLKKIDGWWKQRDFVVEGDWADVGKEANYAVAEACAQTLSKL